MSELSDNQTAFKAIVNEQLLPPQEWYTLGLDGALPYLEPSSALGLAALILKQTEIEAAYTATYPSSDESLVLSAEQKQYKTAVTEWELFRNLYNKVLYRLRGDLTYTEAVEEAVEEKLHGQPYSEHVKDAYYRQKELLKYWGSLYREEAGCHFLDIPKVQPATIHLAELV